MSVLTNLDIVKIAIKICNDNDFKSKIFSGTYSNQETELDCKDDWDRRVESKALSLLRAYNLEKNQKDVVIGVVFAISLRMLIWIEYHIRTFNFPRNFCIDFLESSLFTPEGIIDSHKVVTKISENAFSNLQDFQLACFYCQKERIPELFSNLSDVEKQLVYHAKNPKLIRQPEIIKFWTYYYMGDIDKLKGEDIKLDQYRLKAAIKSGSQVAVEYCLRRMCLKTKQSNVADIAVDVVNDKLQRKLEAKEPNSNFVNDTVVFRKRKYNCKKDCWTPDFFSIDMFYSLLSEMTKSQKIDMLRKLFNAVQFETPNLKSSLYEKVFDLFLCWPYQDQFLQLLKLSWEYLPFSTYGSILLEILDRIEPEMGHFWYGEDKICDFRNLLMEIWTASPENFKRYIFSDKKRLFQNKDDPQGSRIIKEGKELLLRMFYLSNFTQVDRRNVMSIIQSATLAERKDFVFSTDGTKVCIMLIEKEKLDLFEELLFICFESSEKRMKFRKKFCFLKAKDACLELVKNDKWDKAEEILRWGELTDIEMAALKRDIITSKDGKQTCRELCLIKPDTASHFVRWCFPYDGAIDEYKKSLLFSDEGMTMCTNFLKNEATELADKLLNWCLPSQDNVNDFKTTLPLKANVSYNLNSDLNDIEKCSIEEFPNRIVDWRFSNTLLSWCFESESQLNGFKRKLLENLKENIILKCIELNKWEVADKFIIWLDLSPDEVKKLKNELFFSCSSIGNFFDDLMTSNENNLKFFNYGGKQQAIERFLNWFLVDKESVCEFTTRYKCYITNHVIQDVINQLNQVTL